MIVIRGIKGEEYARKIEQGIVDCRDILSALLQPPVTGYEYSDYYEKNMVKALTYFTGDKGVDITNPKLLYSLLVDYYVPHIYLTYFHILNKNSIAWLEKFDDDYKFIALNINLDKVTRTAIGNEYFGAKMEYVSTIRELKQDAFLNYRVACMCSIEHLFGNKCEMTMSMNIYNTLFFPLLCREQDDRFTDIENEFRIIAYDCPKIENGMMKQIPREAVLMNESGKKYKGVLSAGENTVFKSNNCVLRNPDILLKDIVVAEQGKLTLDSKFKSIDINQISNECWYIGDKVQCADFIKKMLMSKPKEIYVNRTVRKKYKIDGLKDAVYVPSYQDVEY